MDFNADCTLCDREAVNSSGLCAKHLKESQTFAPPEIRSGEWMDELRAALRHVQNALTMTPDWKVNWTAGNEAKIAERCLKTAIASDPSRSSIEKLCHGSAAKNL